MLTPPSAKKLFEGQFLDLFYESSLQVSTAVHTHALASVLARKPVREVNAIRRQFVGCSMHDRRGFVGSSWGDRMVLVEAYRFIAACPVRVASAGRHVRLFDTRPWRNVHIPTDGRHQFGMVAGFKGGDDLILDEHRTIARELRTNPRRSRIEHPTNRGRYSRHFSRWYERKDASACVWISVDIKGLPLRTDGPQNFFGRRRAPSASSRGLLPCSCFSSGPPAGGRMTANRLDRLLLHTVTLLSGEFPNIHIPPP
jgi:hypothetical protein